MSDLDRNSPSAASGPVKNESARAAEFRPKPVVLFVSHDASRTGAPLCLSEFLEAVAKQDTPFQPVLFVTGEGPLLEEWRRRRLQVTVSRKRVRAGIALRALTVLRSAVVYIRLLRAVKPKLVYSNTIRNGLEVVLGRIFGARTLVHVHEGERIMRQYSLTLRLSSLFTTTYVCASRYSAASLEKVLGRESSVVYNGVDVDSVQVSDNRWPSGDVMFLGMVGGIQPNKGQRIAIEALSQLLSRYKMQVRLRIFGEVEDPEYRRTLEQAIDALELGSFVEFCGSVADRPVIYDKMDVLILASRDESFSRVVLEALAFGKPVIAANVGGVSEIVTDRENGMLVPPEDPARLAEAIAALASDPDLVRRIREFAARDVRERFRLENTIAGLRALVENALK